VEPKPGFLDPFIVAAAMVSVTSSVGIAVTGSTSYIPPNMNARQFSALDQLSKGRIRWNIITSFSKSATQAFGQKDTLAQDERYNMAEEYMVYSVSFLVLDKLLRVKGLRNFSISQSFLKL